MDGAALATSLAAVLAAVVVITDGAVGGVARAAGEAGGVAALGVAATLITRGFCRRKYPMAPAPPASAATSSTATSSTREVRRFVGGGGALCEAMGGYAPEALGTELGPVDACTCAGGYEPGAATDACE